MMFELFDQNGVLAETLCDLLVQRRKKTTVPRTYTYNGRDPGIFECYLLLFVLPLPNDSPRGGD